VPRHLQPHQNPAKSNSRRTPHARSAVECQNLSPDTWVSVHVGCDAKTAARKQSAARLIPAELGVRGVVIGILADSAPDIRSLQYCTEAAPDRENVRERVYFQPWGVKEQLLWSHRYCVF